MPILIAVLGILVLVLLISYVRLNTFLSFLLVHLATDILFMKFY